MLLVFNDGTMKDLCMMHGTVPVPYKGKWYYIASLGLVSNRPHFSLTDDAHAPGIVLYDNVWCVTFFLLFLSLLSGR